MEFRDVTSLFLEAAAGEGICHPSKDYDHSWRLFFEIMKTWSLIIWSSWTVLLCRTR